MAGLPAHALDGYVGKLLAAGKKVAICDQAEPGRVNGVRLKLAAGIPIPCEPP
jgi:DNA mismatch repair ATPase MutS